VGGVKEILLWLAAGMVALLAIDVLLVVVQTVRRRSTQPVPPTDVRITTRWGAEIPVQCVYVGRFDGIHRWEVIRPQGVNTPFDVAAVKVERLPGKTAIAMFRAEETEM
jgi:hypothetical protein